MSNCKVIGSFRKFFSAECKIKEAIETLENLIRKGYYNFDLYE